MHFTASTALIVTLRFGIAAHTSILYQTTGYTGGQMKIHDSSGRKTPRSFHDCSARESSLMMASLIAAYFTRAANAFIALSGLGSTGTPPSWSSRTKGSSRVQNEAPTTGFP
jgi:hypothetical protein